MFTCWGSPCASRWARPMDGQHSQTWSRIRVTPCLRPLKFGVVLTMGLYPTRKDPMNQLVQKWNEPYLFLYSILVQCSSTYVCIKVSMGLTFSHQCWRKNTLIKKLLKKIPLKLHYKNTHYNLQWSSPMGWCVNWPPVQTVIVNWWNLVHELPGVINGHCAKQMGLVVTRLFFLYRNLSAHDKGRGEKGRYPRVYILEKEICIFLGGRF